MTKISHVSEISTKYFPVYIPLHIIRGPLIILLQHHPPITNNSAISIYWWAWKIKRFSPNSASQSGRKKCNGEKEEKKANAIVSLPNELVKLTLVPQKGGGGGIRILHHEVGRALYLSFSMKRKKERKKKRALVSLQFNGRNFFFRPGVCCMCHKPSPLVWFNMIPLFFKFL